MAKESMKARERKREATVAKYAAKRRFTRKTAQPLQTYRKTKRLHENLWYFQSNVPRDGQPRSYPGR